MDASQDPIAIPCEVVPSRLMAFIEALEHTETSEDAWLLFVGLCKEVGIDFVDYVIATDHQDWQKVQFIRTTLPSNWIQFANQDPRVRRMSSFRTHSVKRLLPISAGIGFLKDHPGVSEERKTFLEEQTARFGVRSSIGIPLRMMDPGQAAHFMLGANITKEQMEAIFRDQGWTLHAAALYVHIRHMELFKLEFSQRNKLTEKQEEILRTVGLGLTDKEIAARLLISISTVRQRIGALQTKTGCKNRSELAALAMRIGVVPDPMTRSHSNDLTVFLSTGDNQPGTEYVKNDT